MTSDGVGPSKPETPGRRDRRVAGDDDGVVEIQNAGVQVGNARHRQALGDHRRLAGVARSEHRTGRLEFEGIAPIGRFALRVDAAGEDTARRAEQERRRFEHERAVGHVPAQPDRRFVEEDALALLAEAQDAGAEVDPGGGVLDRPVPGKADVGPPVNGDIGGEQAVLVAERGDDIGQHELRNDHRHDVAAGRGIADALHRGGPAAAEAGRGERRGDPGRRTVDRDIEVGAGEAALRPVGRVEHRNRGVDDGETLEAGVDGIFEVRFDATIDLIERGEDFREAAVGEPIGPLVGQRRDLALLAAGSGGVADVDRTVGGAHERDLRVVQFDLFDDGAKPEKSVRIDREAR
jgi:hypothetical protein